MKNFKLFSSALTMLIFLTAFGQERVITGTVSDKNELLPFVSVLIKGTTIGTQTDMDGKFSIKAKNGAILVFTYVGYDHYEQEIGAKVSDYFITLKSNAVLLEETYGDPIPKFRKKEEFSTIKVSEEELKKPMEKKPLIIHCAKSISDNNKPLYILDDEIVSDTILKTIAPETIANVKVLKNKEATELYGSKGSNGVIIIETKEYQEEKE